MLILTIGYQSFAVPTTRAGAVLEALPYFSKVDSKGYGKDRVITLSNEPLEVTAEIIHNIQVPATDDSDAVGVTIRTPWECSLAG